MDSLADSLVVISSSQKEDSNSQRADSQVCLLAVVSLVAERGWKVGNVDVTIALQRPKLAPYIGRMRTCLAGILGVEEDCVSIDFSTFRYDSTDFTMSSSDIF